MRSGTSVGALSFEPVTLSIQRSPPSPALSLLPESSSMDATARHRAENVSAHFDGVAKPGPVGPPASASEVGLTISGFGVAGEHATAVTKKTWRKRPEKNMAVEGNA